MKFLIASLVTILSFSAVADDQHMIEFAPGTSNVGRLSFSDSKDQGQSKENSTNLALALNYAYRLGSSHFQLGALGSYAKSHSNGSSSEASILGIGGVYNFSADFKDSVYVSLYVGYGWDPSSEYSFAKASVGKRFPLKVWNFQNVAYSPSVSLSSQNYSSSSSQWSQSLSFNFHQFSVFF